MLLCQRTAVNQRLALVRLDDMRLQLHTYPSPNKSLRQECPKVTYVSMLYKSSFCPKRYVSGGNMALSIKFVDNEFRP